MSKGYRQIRSDLEITPDAHYGLLTVLSDAYSIHDSIASKVISMVKRIDIQDDIVFAGGCARNPCLRRILEERLQKTLYVHENPYMHAAYGAALYADI
jgi:activator of 2-hydroxyglutaryl-CoA dehydratase